MRLSKAQLKYVTVIQNGGYIWLAAGHPYLAYVDKEGRVKSEAMHGKAFTALKERGIIKEDAATKKWVLA